MRAAVATVFDAENPVVGLKVGPHEGKAHPDGWVRVNIKAAALNHHDVWTLRGVATPEANLPIVLGSDGAGVTDDGREVSGRHRAGAGRWWRRRVGPHQLGFGGWRHSVGDLGQPRQDRVRQDTGSR